MLGDSIRSPATGKLKKRSGPKSKTSPYIGVTQYRKTLRWEAHIWIPDPKGKGGQKHLGSYESAEIAARCYDRAAIKTRGSGAELNFPYHSYKDDQFLKDNIRLSREPFFKLLRETYAIKPAAGVTRPRPTRPGPVRPAQPSPDRATPDTTTDCSSDTSTQPPHPVKSQAATPSYQTGGNGAMGASGIGGDITSSRGSSSGVHQAFELDELLVANPLLPSLEGEPLWAPASALPMLPLSFSPPLPQQHHHHQQREQQQLAQEKLLLEQRFSLLPGPDGAAFQSAMVRRSSCMAGMDSVQGQPLLTSVSTPSLSHISLLLPQDQFDTFHPSSTAPQALLTFIPVGNPVASPQLGPLWASFPEDDLQGGSGTQGLADSGAGRQQGRLWLGALGGCI